MSMRLEYKFLVSTRQLDRLKADLTPYIELDPFAAQQPGNEYTVRSIYFDTAKLRYYHEKIEGLKVRKKIRIRGYNAPQDNSFVFLEIKRKYENYISKSRAGILYRNLDSWFHRPTSENGLLDFPPVQKNIDAGKRFMHHVIHNNLNPTVLIVYDREAFYSKFNNSLRMTFDKNLRYLQFPEFNQLYDEDKLQMAMTSHLIFEIKFTNGFPVWLQRILARHHLSRQALSKYTICLDSVRGLHPGRRRSLLAFTGNVKNGFHLQEGSY